MATHETYLNVLLQQGLLGISWYLALIVFPLVALVRRGRARMSLNDGRLIRAVVGAVAVIAMGGLALDLLAEKATWVTLGIGTGMASLVWDSMSRSRLGRMAIPLSRPLQLVAHRRASL